MGPDTHPPSAFDFPTLARFLSTFPFSFLRSAKLSTRVAQWIARFDHLDAQHLRTVMGELAAGNEGEQFDEKQFSQKLTLFTRVFALSPKKEMFAELIGQLKSQLDSKGKQPRLTCSLFLPFSLLLIVNKGPKLDICTEITRGILQALHEVRLSEEDKRAYGSILEPVISPLMAHIKVQIFMRIPIKLTLHCCNRIRLRYSWNKFLKMEMLIWKCKLPSCKTMPHS